MLIRNFIDQYKETIICEPSGISYEQLQKNKIKKIQIIDPMYYEIDKIKI